MTLYDGAINVGYILDNYADCIEGGALYAGGTTHPGCPALDYESGWLHEEDLISGLTFAAHAASTTSTLYVATTALSSRTGLAATINASITDWEAIYPAFAICIASDNGNAGIWRRIASIGSSGVSPIEYNNAVTFVSSMAMPNDIVTAETYVFRRGFRRAPDAAELDDLEAPQGWDRFFSLSMLPGTRQAWYGNGIEHYVSTMALRVRFVKKARHQQIIDRAFASMQIMRAAICDPDSRDSQGVVQAVTAEEPPRIVANDKNHLILESDFSVHYRINVAHQ